MGKFVALEHLDNKLYEFNVKLGYNYIVYSSSIVELFIE